MKKIIVVLAGLLLSVTAFAQKHHHTRAKQKTVPIEIAPEAVQSAFTQAYANAGNVKWQKTANGNWNVLFTEDSLQTSVTYTETGALMATHTEYTADDLPAVITTAVKSKYPDVAIKEGEKVEWTDVPGYYKVTVDEGGASRDLFVNEAGTTITE